jgi:hypothetical protein
MRLNEQQRTPASAPVCHLTHVLHDKLASPAGTSFSVMPKLDGDEWRIFTTLVQGGQIKQLHRDCT